MLAPRAQLDYSKRHVRPEHANQTPPALRCLLSLRGFVVLPLMAAMVAALSSCGRLGYEVPAPTRSDAGARPAPDEDAGE